MKVTNISKRLIVLNYKDDEEGFKTLSLSAKQTVEIDALHESDVAFYVKKGSIKIEKVTDEKAADEKVVQEDNATKESLNDLNVKTLKKYCKENDIEIKSDSKKDDIIQLILDFLEKKE